MKISKKAQKALRAPGTYEAQLIVHWLVNGGLEGKDDKGRCSHSNFCILAYINFFSCYF